MQNRLESLLSLLEQDPEDTFTKYAIALEYHSINEDEKAVEYLESIISKDKDYLAAYQQLGQILAMTNEKQKAIEIYKQGVSVALKIGDKHAAANLQSLINQLS